MKIKADWIDKELSKITVRARYNSQWTDVVDKEIAKKSLKLGIEYAINENTSLIEFYERERVNYKKHEQIEPEFYQLHINLINKFIEQLKNINETISIITQ